VFSSQVGAGFCGDDVCAVLISWGMKFIELLLFAVCTLLRRARARKKKLGYIQYKSKGAERSVSQAIWRLSYVSKKILQIL
jgi:hypothetical protein